MDWVACRFEVLGVVLNKMETNRADAFRGCRRGDPIFFLLYSVARVVRGVEHEWGKW